MNSQICPVCQCRFDDSNCFHFDGIGTTDKPLSPQATFDPATDNLLECGPAGLAAFLPPYLLDPPCCNIYSTINQSIPYDTTQILFFNEERYDTDSMHDEATDSNRISIKTSGVYLVTLNVTWKKSVVDSGDVAVFIRRNGAQFLGIDSMPIADPDLQMSHSLSVEYEFETGDWLDAIVRQDALVDSEGRPMTVLADSQLPTFAAMFMRPTP